MRHSNVRCKSHFFLTFFCRTDFLFLSVYTPKTEQWKMMKQVLMQIQRKFNIWDECGEMGMGIGGGFSRQEMMREEEK